MKDAAEESPTLFRLEPVADSVVPVTLTRPGLSEQAASALTALRGACVTGPGTIRSGEWLTSTGMAPATFYRSLKELLTADLVAQNGIGKAVRYRPTDPIRGELGEEL